MLAEEELVELAETTSPPTYDTVEINGERFHHLNSLNATERRWVHYRSWLKVRAGYDLRPRYHPGWEPPPNSMYAGREDCLEQRVRPTVLRVRALMSTPPQSLHVLDAIRISNGQRVLFKVIPDDPLHDLERITLQHLNSPSLMADPRNHTVPLLDVLKLPHSGESTLVMPLLHRFDDPPFETVGEAVEFFRQIFEVCAEVDIPGHLIYLLPFTGLALHARTSYRSWVRASLQGAGCTTHKPN